MDDEQKKWYEQYSASFGVREYFRFGCFIMLWISLGGVLAIISKSSTIFTIAFIAMFVFAFISPRWKPAYSLLRILWGNKNLPTEPMPRSTARHSRPSRPWWSYLPGIWWILIDLLLLYAILKYLKK